MVEVTQAVTGRKLVLTKRDIEGLQKAINEYKGVAVVYKGVLLGRKLAWRTAMLLIWEGEPA